MSDTTEERPAESLFPAEWPAQDGQSAAASAPGAPASGPTGARPTDPAANPGSAALPPIFPPLPPVSAGLPAPDTAAPDAPAASHAILDADTDRVPAVHAAPPPSAPVSPEPPRPSALDIETTRLPRHLPALDGATERLTPQRPVINVETERLSGAFPAPDHEAERLRRARTGLDQQDTETLSREQLAAQIETEILKRNQPPIDQADTEALPPDQIETELLGRGHLSLDQQATTLLGPQQVPVDQEETERLQRQRTAIDQEETERLARRRVPVEDEETERLARRARGSVEDEETERLKPKDVYLTQPEGLPRYPPDPAPALTAPLEDEDSLQQEIGAALAGYAPILPAPMTPSQLNGMEPTAFVESAETSELTGAEPGAASALAPTTAMEVADEPEAVMVAEAPAPAEIRSQSDESLVRALRREMFPRLSLGRRALTFFSQPDVILLTLFTIAQLALLAFSHWPGAQPAETSVLAQSARIAQGDGLGATLSGFGQMAGAPLWAAFAGVGALLGGLLGARVLAILCIAGAGLATARAAKNLFGATASVFTAALFALSGPFIYIAHLATPDHLALLGVAVSFWAITQANEMRRDEWLLIAVAAFAVAATAQFAALGLLVPLGLVMLAQRRQSSTMLFYSILGLAVLALLVSRFAPSPVSVLAILPHRGPSGFRLDFSASAAGLQLAALSAVAWVAALAGWIAAAAREQGRLAAALFTGLLFGPIIAALAGGARDGLQYTTPSLLFGLPLMSVAFAALWTGGQRLRVGRQALAVALLLVAGGIGLLQAQGLSAPSALRPAHGVHFSWGRGAIPTAPRIALATHSPHDAAAR